MNYREFFARLVKDLGAGRLVLLLVAVFALGVGIGAVSHWGKPQPRPQQQSQSQPQQQHAALPTAEMAAAAPHPSVPATAADAPATEVSPHTVIEGDEGTGHPVQTAALPPAAHPPARQPSVRPNVDHPMIALIIDDMGVDKKRSERVLKLPGPLTLSFMSYADDLARQAREAKEHGHELMMHVPMEPLAADVDPGPEALLTSLSHDELKRRIEENLDRFSGYDGINNHMGSKFTAYQPGMRLVMEALSKRKLFFVDSMTTDHSVGLEEARAAGIPSIGRNVFIDNVGEVGAVEAQLAKCEDLARRKGIVVAIGHPREATIAALTAWLPNVAKKGITLIPVSTAIEIRGDGANISAR